MPVAAPKRARRPLALGLCDDFARSGQESLEIGCLAEHADVVRRLEVVAGQQHRRAVLQQAVVVRVAQQT